MSQEIGTDKDLLWKLLLAQIVYDESNDPNVPVDFAKVAQVYRDHPLVPSNAPRFATGKDANIAFDKLLKEYEISLENDLRTKSTQLAEPLYIKFHQNLLEKMQEDVDNFGKTYRQYEVQENFPQDERLQD